MSPQLSRRGAIVAVLALPAAAVAPTEVLAQFGCDADPVEVVHHWIEEVVRPLQAQFGQLAHPDGAAWGRGERRRHTACPQRPS